MSAQSAPNALLNYRYKVLKALAEGGFGKTFLAEDTQMPSKRRCVIKQLKPVSNRPDISQLVQERFTREAAVLDAVGKNHDQIPTLYAYFVDQGQFYLVQEWIEGEPLQVAAHQVITEEKAWQILKDLLPAIAHVHSKNVIHRDIKPDNIIIRKADQRPCLIDFGAVKELMSTVVSPAGHPKSSIVIGTAGYMPPEQAAGRPTFSSDLYSLGMTILCVLTGKHPAAIPTDSRTGQLLWQQYMPGISAELERVLSQAIHPYPQQRYHSATEMLAALGSPTAHVVSQPPIPNSPAPVTASAATTPATATLTTTTVPASLLPMPNKTAVGTVASTRLQGIHPQQPPSHATTALPVKGIALTAVACAVGAGVLIAVRPTTTFNTGTFDTAASAGNRSQSRATDKATDKATATETSNANIPTTKQSSAQPTSAEDFTNRAIRLYSEGRLTQARQDVDKALEIAPNTLEALSLKGDILANQSHIDLPGAIAAYTQALAVAPDNREILQKRCTTYQRDKAYELAHQDCTQLIALTPSATLYDQRGDIRSAQENYLGAIADYTQAIEINERDGNPSANQSIYYSRGNAYAASGEPGKGLEDFEKMREP